MLVQLVTVIVGIELFFSILHYSVQLRLRYRKLLMLLKNSILESKNKKLEEDVDNVTIELQ